MICCAYVNIDVDPETAAFISLVRLTCTKRTVRLPKEAQRKTWAPTVSDCCNGLIFISEVWFAIISALMMWCLFT